MMNKPLLQWKREIEEEIEQLKYQLQNNEFYEEGCFYEEDLILVYLNKQLQMINDIIKMVEQIDYALYPVIGAVVRYSEIKKLIGE